MKITPTHTRSADHSPPNEEMHNSQDVGTAESQGTLRAIATMAEEIDIDNAGTDKQETSENHRGDQSGNPVTTGR